MIGLLRSIKEGAARHRARAPACRGPDELEAAVALWARRLLAETLLTSGWHRNTGSCDPFPVMAFACPRALTAIATEILAF
jgi:hypothetical protein